MSTEVLLVEQYIYTTLAADTAITDLIGLSIYGKVAPQGAPGHRIIFQNLSAPARNGLGGKRRIFMTPLFAIFQEYDQEHNVDTNLLTISRRLDLLFDKVRINSTPDTAGLRISSSRLIDGFSRDSVSDNDVFETVGGKYRFWIARSQGA